MLESTIGNGEIDVLGVRLDPVARAEAGELIGGWARDGWSRVVCVANVHVTMEAWDDPGYGAIVASADLVVPDGRPLVWALRLRGASKVEQVRGQDLVFTVCEIAARRRLNVGIYGSTEPVLAAAKAFLEERFPGLVVSFIHSPPFSPVSPVERAAVLKAIAEAGVQVLFVATGCPKQERWMAEHRDDVSAVMIGVGAAIDMIAGYIPVAPRWMQRSGLEWTVRLAADPQRLWRRYAKHNVRFVAYFGRQLLAERASKLLNGRGNHGL